jgi:hypothetical protein
VKTKIFFFQRALKQPGRSGRIDAYQYDNASVSVLAREFLTVSLNRVSGPDESETGRGTRSPQDVRKNWMNL